MTDQKSLVNLSKVFFFVYFECGFYWSKSKLLDAPTSRSKKIVKQFFPPCVSLCISSESVSQIFKITFQTGDINKHPQWNLRKTCGEAVKV